MRIFKHTFYQDDVENKKKFKKTEDGPSGKFSGFGESKNSQIKKRNKYKWIFFLIRSNLKFSFQS